MFISYPSLRYILSGAIINFLGFFLYILLFKFFNLSPIVSVLIQYPIIITLYFISQSIFVFKKKITLKRLFKFLLNISFILILNVLLLFIFVEKFQFDAIITQLIFTFLLIIFNYFSQKKMVFN